MTTQKTTQSEQTGLSRIEKNLRALNELRDFMTANPDQRFWQAVLNFTGLPYIMIVSSKDGIQGLDTFYWEDLVDTNRVREWIQLGRNT